MSIEKDGVVMSDPATISNCFADRFEAVYVMNVVATSTSSLTLENSLGPFSYFDFSPEMVVKEIETSNLKTGPGTDNFPPKFWFECRNSLPEPLSLLFSLSLRAGRFPHGWKQAFITPIPKKSNAMSVDQYRPISFLNFPSKILESLILKFLSPLNKTFSDSQHGFMSKRSTTSNLACLINFIAQAMDRGSQVDVIYLDFKKAFDRIPHKILLGKLECMGVVNPQLLWMSSYLTDRKQLVRWNGAVSRVVNVSSGDPQGSKLGPWLFLAYINDLVMSIKSSQKLFFADDSKIYMDVGREDDCLVLQRELDGVLSWCTANLVEINADKCHVVTYTRKHSNIMFPYKIGSTLIRDLGVIMDSGLRFDRHLDDVCSWAARMIGFIRRNAGDIKDPKALTALYSGLVRSVLEYASPIWTPYMAMDNNRLKSIQRRFKRFYEYGVKKELELETLEARICRADLMFFAKILNNDIDCPELLSQVMFHRPTLRLRKNETLAPPDCNNPAFLCSEM